MANWSDRFKGLGTSAAKAIATGAKTALNAAQEQIKDSKSKRQIINKMYPQTVKELAHQRGLHPEPFLGGKPTIDDYKESLASNMTLKELIEFARKKRIDIRDVTDRIDEEKATKEQKQLENDDTLSSEFKLVTQCIRDFRPFKNYQREYMYQVELGQYLRKDYPNTRIEEQRGSSRPDIDVNGIGIEVKGPTFDQDLNTIADKLLRYSQRFPKGVIVVLFDVRVNPHRYEELMTGIKVKFPKVEIIRK